MVIVMRMRLLPRGDQTVPHVSDGVQHSRGGGGRRRGQGLQGEGTMGE